MNTVTSQKYDKGWHKIFLSSENYKSGAYICKLKHNDGVVVLKLIIIK